MIELLIGLGTPLPLEQSVIDSITKEPPAIVQTVAPVELTLQQKIDTNHYKCDTDLEWIWASDATCHPKQAQSTTRTQSTAKTPQNSPGNAYQPGQCVWFIKNMRPEIPNSWGSAYSWIGSAQSQGWPTGSIPRVNAVGVRGNHVVLVTSINADGSVNITDMNGRWVPFEIGYGTHPASYYTYIY